MLVRSFNTMTTQLRDSRSQIDEFTRNLQLAVQELERRRQLMETVLENIPAGRRLEAFRRNDGGWAQQMKNIESHVAQKP